MHLNERILIEGNGVVLVPYKEHHVLKYNEWMQSQELQQLTASEPLTLQQEYDMQKSWHSDEDKCTFIILQSAKWKNPEISETDCMCGDVNLYLIRPDNSDDVRTAEIEIMIADGSCRRKGLGREALILMIQFGRNRLQMARFMAKIGLRNEPSLRLFKKLGFKEESVSGVFQEVTLYLNVTDDYCQSLEMQTTKSIYREYKAKR